MNLIRNSTKVNVYILKRSDYLKASKNILKYFQEQKTIINNIKSMKSNIIAIFKNKYKFWCGFCISTENQKRVF